MSNYVNELPTELMVLVFSFLEFRDQLEAEKVCKRWRDVGRTMPWNRRTLIVLRPRNFTTGPLNENLRVHGSRIPRLEFSNRLSLDEIDQGSSVEHFAQEWIWSSATSCRNLKVLSLYLNLIADDTLIRISQVCKKLQVVSLNGRFGDEGIRVLLDNCPIRALELQSSVEFSGRGLCGAKQTPHELCLHQMEPSPLCRNIRFVGIRACPNFDLPTFFELCGKSLISLRQWRNADSEQVRTGLGYCEELEYLHLWDDDFSDAILEVAANRCKKLSLLELHGLHRMSSNGYDSVARLPSLRELIVYGCDNVDAVLCEERLMALSTTKSLQKISIYYDMISAKGIECLLKSCGTLQVLAIDCHRILGEFKIEDVERFGFVCSWKYGNWFLLRKTTSI